jgi:peroxiredoxin
MAAGRERCSNVETSAPEMINRRTILFLLLAASFVGPASCSRPPAANLDFVLKDMNGQDVRLADFKGRPILINFWATWCPPCKAEIPWFVDMANQYKAQNLAVVGISIDDTAEDIRAFATQYKVNYPMLVGSGHDDLIAAYEAGLVVPVSWLIKADGTVLEKVKGMHGREWFNERVQALFVD